MGSLEQNIGAFYEQKTAEAFGTTATPTSSEPLTMASLLATAERLKIGRASKPLRIIEAPYLVSTRPRKLTRQDRFWLWIESLCERAETYYYGPKIERTVSEPLRKVVVVDGTAYCHPIVAEGLRARLRDC